MKYPKLLLSMALLCYALSSSGQSDFRPGYYIENDHDTIHGLIDYRGDLRNAKYCVYKSAPEAEAISFEAGEIFAYRFGEEGKFYISKYIDSDGEPTPIFLEYLVNGITDLYYTRDEKDRYFLENEDGKIMELKNEESILEKDGMKYVWKSNEHIATLKSTFADCMEIQPQLDRAQLTHKSLIKLTSSYHDYVCDDEMCIIYQKDVPKVKASLGLVIGMASSRIDFVIYEGYEDLVFEPGLDPYIGVQLSLSSPRVSEKISVLIQAEWTKIYYHSYAESTISTITYHQDYHLRQNSIRAMLGLQYALPLGRISPTIALGPLFDYRLKNEYRRIQEAESPPMVHTSEYINEPLLKNDTMGAFFQLGANVQVTKRQYVSCNVRYHRSSETFGTKIVYNAYSLNLGYFF